MLIPKLILLSILLPYLLESAEDDDDDNTYDYLVLALTWPEGYCDSIGDGCNRTKLSNTWTIHGLWPTLGDQITKPAFCSGGAFNSQSIGSQLRSKLRTAWPNYRVDSSDESFWSYEWSKHGTCALIGDPDTFPTQTSYFSKTLQLYEKFNFNNILQKSDITPGTITTLSELKSIFNRHFGVKGTVAFQCSSSSNHQMLTGSHFCLSDNFTVVSCPSGKTDRCSYSTPVLYASGADTTLVSLFLMLLAITQLFVFIS